MKRALLYSPMNPPAPGEPPSGDRAMAGLLSRALEMTGYAVESASAFRSYEASGNAAQQAGIATAARVEADRLIQQWRDAPPQVWITYLNYYRSPDYLGPAVSSALGIPYVIVEGSYAGKRESGDFAAPHAAAKKALEAAHAVWAMTAHDEAGLRQVVAAERLHRLPPFIDAARYRPARRANRTPVILSVAMLRPGKKLANFPLIAATLARVSDLRWTWLLAGDGPGRADVETIFRAFPRDRVVLAGRIPPEAMPAIYARSDIYLWPGLREAYGLSYLEAQASALPVVACDTHGVPAVVEQGRGGLLAPTGDADALAQSLRILLSNQLTRETMGEVAREFVTTERTVAGAARALAPVLRAIGA